MAKRYSVVVVGMGKRGVHHATAFHANPRFQVVGVCDIDRARAEAGAAKVGGPKADTDAARMASELRPDVFCFCTLPNIRTDLIRKSGVKAVVSHQHRYGEHYRKVKEVIASGALGRVHTVYGTATGWMMHMLTHLIDYMRWYAGEPEAEWVLAQAAGRGKLADVHSSPDYIAGFVHFQGGIRGIVECGAGAPDVPEVDYWWRKCRIGAQGTDGFAEVLTGGGWRAVTKSGAQSGTGCMNYDLDMPPYIQEMADWLDDERKVHSSNFESAYKGFEILAAMCRSVAEGGQVALPLASGAKELDLLAAKLPAKKVLLSMAANAKEYGA